ncbi:MAG TPA: winged helix DNA-binding domain-containing protein [Candidatus Dormibacteraeota bacterium]
MADPVLSQRTLNRTLLARQHLIDRVRAPALAEIEHLVGMQAQVPNAPYVGLWSRLENFEPAELARLVEGRQAVRLGIMRNTLHLVSARDCLSLWPLFAPLLAQRLRATHFARELPDVDFDAVVRETRRLLERQARTFAQLGLALKERWPNSPAEALAYVARHLLPLVQVPPRGVWGKRGQATWSTAQLWLGQPLVRTPSVESVLLRYLAAFGPASVADMAAWSGLSGLRKVVDRLRPDLRSFRDEKGRELLDIPNGVIQDPTRPVPPRFLPEFDNLLLSHDDRTRVIAPPYRYMVGNGTFLLDGLVAGIWKPPPPTPSPSSGGGGITGLTITSFQPITAAQRKGLAEEGERLLSFLSPSSDHGRIELAVAPARSAWSRPSTTEQ